MIKLVYVVHRRPDVPEANFYDYWLNKHGPLVEKHAKAIRAKKYIQSHLVDDEANEALRSARGMLPPIAGITEIWWDSLEEFQEAYATTEAQASSAELAVDEEKFIDVKASSVFLTQEHVILDYTDRKPLGDKAVKCVYLVVKRDDITQDTMFKTWKQDHGPLFISVAEAVDASKYIQSHTIIPEMNKAMMTSRGLAPPLDGITEVWVADPAASLGGEDAERAMGILIEDERRFVQLDRSRCFLTKEHVIFNYT